MLASAFEDPRNEGNEEEMEEMTTFEEVIQYLESIAESLPYLDDYPIIVTDACKRPFIVMSVDEFNKLNRELVGQ